MRPLLSSGTLARPMAGVQVRRAVSEDAAVAVGLLRASITKLCVADHRNDPDSLKLWLRNKTVENFAHWLDNTDLHVVFAELDSTIRGVESVHNSRSRSRIASHRIAS